MEKMSTENNQWTSNLVSFNTEQLEHGDKADSISYSVCQTNGRFSLEDNSVHASVKEDYGGDPFSLTVSDPMEVRKNLKPRQRRVSDVIDSIGDCVPDTDGPQTVPRPERVAGTREPDSPMSSGYGSADSGTPKLEISPPDSLANLPSPKKFWQVPHVDVTDAAVSATDALPMSQDQDKYHRDPVEAVMPVEKDAEEYNMNHKRRGKAVIFNNDKFDNDTMRPRDGSHVDVQNLEVTYKALDFDVKIHDNLEYSEMKSVINSLAQEDHSDADCLLVTVLTHGMGSTYLLSKDVPYSVEMLWSPFTADNCPTLAGKPKVFIIQACRGEKMDPGVTLKERRGSRTETDSSPASYKIPTHADFLIAYSSAEGHYSWRNPDKGTWFIQCLCHELNEHAATRDLLKIMTRTSRRVAVDHESYNDLVPWQHQQKQVPSFNSMLIRDLYFRPKI